ncbi:BgTH12-05083 [Blumeria graminis f. sp. triticale]|uniref:BgTH12-05083 n=1 Tax=Blumeria graminis f. sp. triticale TaxID=1689686 RepID=A0A9W4GF55_BLUGR|nr:BgTH12-05083 [Blumeria graminis f. sp. triticale]
MAIHTITSLDEYHKLAKSHDKIIIRFTEECNGPCKTIAPLYEKLSETHKDIFFLSVNVDKCKDVATEFKINSMPTYFAVKTRKIDKVLVGANFYGLTKLVASFK